MLCTQVGLIRRCFGVMKFRILGTVKVFLLFLDHTWPKNETWHLIPLKIQRSLKNKKTLSNELCQGELSIFKFWEYIAPKLENGGQFYQVSILAILSANIEFSVLSKFLERRLER